MTILKYIIKSFWFYKKQHLAVIIGTLISTAVLTGALIIGDSVRLSLQSMVDARLGKAEFAMVTGDRFVRSELADELSEKLDTEVVSALMLQGIAINPDSNLRVNATQVIGVDQDFWNMSAEPLEELKSDEAYINEELAYKLALNIGDEFLLRVEKASVIPLNAPFASEEEPSVSFRLVVKGIAGNNQLGRFSLKSNQTAQQNIFVTKENLARRLELEDLSNLLLVSDSDKEYTAQDLDNHFKEIWKLKDANLTIRELDASDQYEILSDRIFVDKPLTDVITGFEQKSEKVLTYLVNFMRYNGKETPYSFVAATSQNIGTSSLQDDEIVVNKWLADDLAINKGDSLELEYFIIGPLRTLQTVKRSFVVKEIIPTQTNLANTSLMPLFPGLADAGSCSEWDAGIPIDLDRIRDKDEHYWDEHKGTPKAYINLAKGQELWMNKYGEYTAVRFNRGDFDKEELESAIIDRINPRDINLVFTSVKDEGKKAASSGVDFGELFLSLSFFVIVAGVLLTVLLYSLNAESRTQESGILAGVGYNKKKIIRLRFYENIFSIVIGGVLGMLAGILYNYALMAGVNTVWQDIVRTNMLDVYILPKTLVIGALSGIVIAIIAIYLVTRKKLKQPVSNLIKGISENKAFVERKRHKRVRLIFVFSLIITIAIVVYSLLSSVDQNAGLFLSAGGIFLVAGISWFSLKLSKNLENTTDEIPGINQFALKNAAKRKSRSIATVTLLALGTFSVIITGANRKTFYGTESNRQSGTGGFAYWVETSLPILFDLNTPYGKEKLGLSYEAVLDSIDFIQTHQLNGDDASCLNLNQVQKPRILGVNPNDFSDRDAFSFVTWHEGVNKENTWDELLKSLGDNVYPAIADQTVIQWGLMKKVGDTLTYLNEAGEEIDLVLIAGLGASIFQGNILVSEEAFLTNFPSVGGSKTMLLDVPEDKKARVGETLNNYLTDYGIQLESTGERLANFYSVTNTYLTVFMVLGGLGVIIGTFGLGVVLLRNILERKSEIALLLATGYKKQSVIKLIFSENLILLITGLVLGILSALIGILPSLLSPSFSLPIGFILILVLAIFISGLIWIWFPSRNAIKKNIIESLRNE